MYGLSGAASIITVISLAVQLGDSVYKLSKLLKSIRNAPKALQTLAKTLDRLQQILAEVQLIAEKQKKQEFAPAPSQALHTALKDCNTQFLSLETCTSKVVASLQGGRKTSASFKIWIRKDDL